MKNIHQSIIPIFLLLLFVIICPELLAQTGQPQQQAEAQKPLLMEGKKSLYQRVITHPGARLHAEPGKEIGSALTSFSVLYVYAREGDWVQVGAASDKADGWLQNSMTTPWKQSMTLLFTPRARRSPVLFFKTAQDVLNICTAKDIGKALGALRDSMQKKPTPADLPVVAMEPPDSEGAIAANRFYLLPIMDVQEPVEGTKFLNVASIDAGAGLGGGLASDFRLGVVFVLDTTISMAPYIEQTRNVVRSVFDSLSNSTRGANLSFAVVAFRSSVEATPGLGYRSKVISGFQNIKDRQLLDKSLAEVKEATVSSHSYNEDSLAGIKTAVDELDWSDFDARLIILVTDAGPLPVDDEYALNKMGVKEINDYARSKAGANIMVVHVKSKRGAGNHAYAQREYLTLSQSGEGSNYYLAVPALTPEQGAKTFAATARAVNEELAKVVNTFDLGDAAQNAGKESEPKTPEETARRMARALGYSFKLDFIGAKQHSAAPKVVSAWIADKDLERLDKKENVPAVEVAVLLTKNQLNDLYNRVKIILDEAEISKVKDSADFFQGILSASAMLSRDAAEFSRKPGQDLKSLGIIGEYLDGLPYKSDIMNMTEEDWKTMSVGQQQAFINKLKSRLARYEEYGKDQSGWESFGSPHSGDWVYRVPLSMLP